MSSENNNKNIFVPMEETVLAFWEQAKIFQKSVDRPAPQGDYSFYDGPPFATGEPHYGHLAGGIMKDVIPRYWTMNGYKVERKWGWDCHGLPIENIAEKELGITHKKEIEAMGVEKFNEFCRSKVLSYVEIWEKIVKRMGRWVDMDNAYRTMDLNYMESIWWVFKQLWDKELIYESYRSMHVCPRCETTLSQSEVAEGYKDVKDLSVIVKFELVDDTPPHPSPYQEEGGKTYVLAWTTTPWTLIGNVALAVGKDIEYVKVKITRGEHKGESYIIAAGKSADIFKQAKIFDQGKKLNEKFNGFAELAKIKTADLIGKKYKPVFDYYAIDFKLDNRENGWKIYGGDFVTTDEGTGIVHIAPAFGEDDMVLGKKYNLPFVQHVSLDGTIKKEAVDFAGLNVKPIGDPLATDVAIIKYLAGRNLLFHKEKYKHSYPHCWRCETPLLNYATTSWFVRVTDIKEQALKTAKKINWSPAYIKEGRFGNWLTGARDWSISRQRYWASVMPIWKCDKCSETKVFGSIQELEEISGQTVTDLHKHVVDKITFSCVTCGGKMKRIPDVLDTWFDSGSMPYAQMHYPFENKAKFEANFPAQFIAEGIDQTRCWFYYLHIIATAIKNKEAYQNVIVNGIVLAEDGKKMAKRLKNYPEPNFIFEQYGADAMRFYLLSSPVLQAENLNFSESGVRDVLRGVIMILWNVYKFYEMYATELKVESYKVESENVLDKWILARLDQLINEVTDNMNKYNLPKATRPIVEFINDLSTWYLRRSRDRFKSTYAKASVDEGDDVKDKEQALATTKYVLVELSKLMAPFMPFLAEQLWQKVTGYDFKDENKSVHLEEWPSCAKALDGKPEIIIDEMKIVRKIVELGLAERDKAGIRVRQPIASVMLKTSGLKSKIDIHYYNLILEELNTEEIKWVADFGDGSEIKIDINITPELERKGMKRDIVRQVNMMRKQAGLTINDRINLYWQSNSEQINNLFLEFSPDIKKETLTETISKEMPVSAQIEKIFLGEEEILLFIEKNKAPQDEERSFLRLVLALSYFR